MHEALALPAEARAFMAEKLLESLGGDSIPELSSAWLETIEHRCREIDEGKVQLRDAAEVFARARAILG